MQCKPVLRGLFTFEGEVPVSTQEDKTMGMGSKSDPSPAGWTLRITNDDCLHH